MTGLSPKQSPYYVAPASMTPLQKHCAFFDRNGDGLIMPWETFAGFRILGYGLFLSLLGTTVIHLFFSYWTLDTWVPDPFFAIVLRNVGRLKHGSDTGVYDHDGSFKPTPADPVTSLIARNDSEQKGGLNAPDLLRMTQNCWDVFDFFGWWAAKLEWFFLWVLAQRNGIVSFKDIRAQYDGSLFEEIERERREAGLVQYS